jgi:hypothetical protein
VKRKILSIVVVLGMLVGLISIPAQAATEGEIADTIQKGVAWLVDMQGGPGLDNGDGSWPGGDPVATTGLAVVKLEERAFELGYDSPFDEDYEYRQNVIDGLNYIFSAAGKSACCPDNGIVFAPGGHETYCTGIAMMAIAASKSPGAVISVGNPLIDGMTYQDVVQNNVDYFVCAQNPDGGWRYQCSDPISDQSNTGYAVLGLSYAEGFGLSVPQTLKERLSVYIDFIQNDQGPADDAAGDTNPDGGSGYANPSSWVNLLKTGNLIFEMTFCEDELSTERFQYALDYMERHWMDENEGCSSLPDNHGWGYNCDPANYQAMYCLMKGLGYSNIPLLDLDGDEDPEHDWLQEFAQVIVDQKIPVGDDMCHWSGCCWGNPVLCTVWALLTIEFIFPDITPPDVYCIEAVNPHGKNVPPAGKTTLPGAKGGNNEDGFYQLIAEDNRDPAPRIFIGCKDCGGPPPPFGPYPSGTIVKITEAPGAVPTEKKIGSDKGQANAVAYHIILPSDAWVIAVDASGNLARFPCFVPPPPK